MAGRQTVGIWSALARFLHRFLALDPGPASLAEEVADRLFDPLLPDERVRLRQLFGVNLETNAALEEFISHVTRRSHRMPTWGALFRELTRTGPIRGSGRAEIAAQHSATRYHIRDIERSALIRLYRWEQRRFRLPKVQQRLIKRIAAAHDEIFESLCDAPPVRPALVGWHDQLVDGRRNASEIAEPPDSLDPDDPEDTPETVLATKIRKALWAVARARKPVRQQDDKANGREDERDKALSSLRDLHLNAQSILAIAEALLGHARRIEVESDEMIPQLLNPVIDPDAPSPPDIPTAPPPRWQGDLPDTAALDPALADAITAEAGMLIAELWVRAGRVDRALTKALHNQRLLVDSCMPMVAEIAVAHGLRGKDFFGGIEKGRVAAQEMAARFCFSAGRDFTLQVEEAIHAVLESHEAAEIE